MIAELVEDAEGSRDHLSSLPAYAKSEGNGLILRRRPHDCESAGLAVTCIDTHESVGYEPDWLLSDVEDLRAKTNDFTVIASPSIVSRIGICACCAGSKRGRGAPDSPNLLC